MKKRKIKSKAKIKRTARRVKAPRIKTLFTNAVLTKFKKCLLQRKEELLGNIGQMEKESLSNPLRESSGNLSNLPIHLGDLGTDQYEQDFTIGVMEGERGSVTEINEALERIADKTFGICELCKKRIMTARLSAVPYARLCVKCQEEDEKKHPRKS